MSAINKRRRQQEQTPKKEEAQPMTDKPETKKQTKRNAPRKIVEEIETRGVVAPITLWEADLPTKDGDFETKTFATFAEATEALKAAKLASKKWTSEKTVAKMLDRLNDYTLDKQYPKELQEDMSIILEAMVQFLEKLKDFNPEKGTDDERAS